MSQKEKVLEMLLSGPKTTADFLQAYIPRFSARIQDLRKDGHTIETERVGAGKFEYRLLKWPMDVLSRSPKIEPISNYPDFSLLDKRVSAKQFEGGLF